MPQAFSTPEPHSPGPMLADAWANAARPARVAPLCFAPLSIQSSSPEPFSLSIKGPVRCGIWQSGRLPIRVSLQLPNMRTISLRERCAVSVGLGVDIVEIERMRRILDRTPSFAHKVFTDAEQDYCNRKGNPATHYAARFAAKEAVCKALGTGILASGIGMRDVEVVRDSHGKPAIALHGAAARIAEEQGVVDVPLSITYTHSVAVANAVAITKASQAEREKRRDVKAELAQQFKEMRGMLDDLGEQTATSAEAKGAGEPVSE